MRPLITMFFEYFLAYKVYKHKNDYSKIISIILFFLASYQFGELIVFITKGNYIGIKIAYFSTTLLPPLGILLMEKITRRNYGYLFFQTISLIFAFLFLIKNNLILNYTFENCCLNIQNYNPFISQYWGDYYIGTLIFTLVIMLSNFVLTKLDRFTKKQIVLLFVGYCSFFFTSISIIIINSNLSNQFASIMCALAVIFAFILYYIDLQKKE